MKIMLLHKLKTRNVSLLTFNILLAIWLGVFLNIAFYGKIRTLTPYTGIEAGLFVVASGIVVTSLYTSIFQFLNWKWTAKPIAIALIVIGGFASYAVNTLGVWITSDQIQNFMQTDLAEARDIWSWHLVVWVISMLVVPILLILMFKIKPEPVIKLVLKKIVALTISLVFIGGLLFIFFVDFAAIFRESRDLKGMISPQNMIGSSISYYKKKAPKKNLPLVLYGEDAHITNSTVGLPKLMVLVVGETARAENFSLNGYAKDTNPKLAKQDILNFFLRLVHVVQPLLFQYLVCSLVCLEQIIMNAWQVIEGLLDVAKRAGYQVTWIDNNSGCKGTCDRVEQFKILESIQQKCCKNGECYDEILVDSLKAYLDMIPKNDQQPRLIVLHQLGSHGPAYYKRVPEQFKIFKPSCDTNAIQGCTREALINSYDNTLLYTDYVLDSLIETLKNTAQYQIGLWYLSDHGESTGESGMYLHGAPYAIAPSQQTHIPMLMWFSPTWQQQAPQQVKCLVQQSKNKLSQDNLFPTMLSLLDIKTKVIDSKVDMLVLCSSY